jgi:rSAM/selenodomain-associated transferase 1
MRSQGAPTGNGPVAVVFAKAPTPGRVMTRLCPPLTPRVAAELQQACLVDLWRRLERGVDAQRVLCFDPPGAADLFRELLGGEVELLPQAAGSLGDRLTAAFEALFAAGFCPVIAIGADSPDLPTEHPRQAIRRLAAGECEVVLGPAEDGGYTLIGLSRPHPGPFEAIPWSTPEVLATTLERCRQAGLLFSTLPEWYDIDDAASLLRLRAAALARPEELPRVFQFFQARRGLTTQHSRHS